MPTAPLLVHAVRAAQRGWHVFPCIPGEKVPSLKWYEAATTDLDTIIRWWQREPEANIGISCKKSGLLVVDCDMPKREFQLKGTPYESLHDTYGPLVDGHDVLRAVCQRYGGVWKTLVDTYSVSTTNMGLHLYYAWPDILASQASVVRGILDVRTNGGAKGGYVLGDGSRTPKGRYAVEEDRPVAPAPPWLVELVREKPRTPAPSAPRLVVGVGGGKNYEGLYATVLDAPEGNRNNALLWASRAMCDDGATLEDALSLLAPAATANGLPEREAFNTIRSGYRIQRRKK